MTGQTKLEKMKAEAKEKGVFGYASQLGNEDSPMLETWDVNKLVMDGEQSQVWAAFELIIKAITLTWDTLYPKYVEELDRTTGQMITKQTENEQWKALERFLGGIKADQMSAKGYAREQYLGETRARAISLATAETEQKKGFLQRVFGK